MKYRIPPAACFMFLCFTFLSLGWVRINQHGYLPLVNGTADLTRVLSVPGTGGIKQSADQQGRVYDNEGAVIRINDNEKSIYIVFSADVYGEGATVILDELKSKGVRGSFFLTGNFLRNKAYRKSVRRLVSEGHFLGPHSDKHLLYAAWENRDSLLVSRQEFHEDLIANYREIKRFGFNPSGERYFLAPYEWYNETISGWSKELGSTLINFTPGTVTNADYTTPDMSNYRSSEVLVEKLRQFESSEAMGLNGAIVLIHLGTDPKRTDKLYNRLGEIIDYYRLKGYTFKRL